MIDVAQYKAEIASIPGDAVIVPRAQLHELLDELEAGQAAKKAIRRIRTITSTNALAIAA